MPRTPSDLADDIVRWHAWHRVKNRCKCGTACSSEARFRLHLVQQAIHEAEGAVRYDAYNAGYKQGWDDRDYDAVTSPRED